MTSAPVTIIAAVCSDGALGRKGQLIYHISDDLRRFKSLTLGSPIIMGRHTFESFPKGALPGRRNIVVTRNTSYTAPGIDTAPSLEAALQLAREDNPREIFIIGGGEIYRQAMPIADRLQITTINAACPDADVHFPTIDPALWSIENPGEPMSDPATGVEYRFVTYRRVTP